MVYWSRHADHWSENFLDREPDRLDSLAHEWAIAFAKMRRQGKDARHFIPASNGLIEGCSDMTRRKSNNGQSSNNRGGSAGSLPNGRGCKWINVKLSDEDILNLEQDASTLEYLAACLLGMVGDGYSVSVKLVDEGSTVMACIIRPSDQANMPDCGVSAFAPDPRDAILSLLYKFENILGGVLDPTLVNGSGTSSRFR